MFNPALVSKKKKKNSVSNVPTIIPFYRVKKLRFKIYIIIKGGRVESSRTGTQTLSTSKSKIFPKYDLLLWRLTELYTGPSRTQEPLPPALKMPILKIFPVLGMALLTKNYLESEG